MKYARKDLLRKSGVYVIKSTVDHRCYIGSSIDIWNRWNSHKVELKKGTHCNSHLQNFYNKYGKESLIYDLIEFCMPDEVVEREQHYFDSLRPEFNAYEYAYSPRGHKKSKETLKKLSNSLKGNKKLSEASKRSWKENRKEREEAIREWAKEFWTEEKRKENGLKISESWTPELRAAKAEEMKKFHAEGKMPPVSEETKVKQSEYWSNKAKNDEDFKQHLARMTELAAKSEWTEERRQKATDRLRKAYEGGKLEKTPEQRDKLSKYWSNRVKNDPEFRRHLLEMSKKGAAVEWTEERLEKHIKNMKEFWTEDRKDEASDRMRKVWTEERKKEQSDRLKKEFADGKRRFNITPETIEKSRKSWHANPANKQRMLEHNRKIAEKRRLQKQKQLELSGQLG